MISAVFAQTLYGVYRFLGLVSDVVFIYCILTWIYMPLVRVIDHAMMSDFRNGNKTKVLSFCKRALGKVFYILQRFTQPLVAPFRRLQSILFGGRLFPIDFSVLFLFFAIRIAQRIILSLYFAALY